MEETGVAISDTTSSNQKVHHQRYDQIYRKSVTEPLNNNFASKFPKDVADVGCKYLDHHDVDGGLMYSRDFDGVSCKGYVCQIWNNRSPELDLNLKREINIIVRCQFQ